MHVLRITDPQEIIENWDVFREGLTEVAKLTGEKMSEESYCKLLLDLTSRGDDAWVGIVFQGGPMSYAVAVNSTPPHAEKKTFLCLSFYAMPGQPDATEFLQREFDRWARTQNISSYVVTTRRTAGGAFRCFWSRSHRYGFRRGYFAFERHL